MKTWYLKVTGNAYNQATSKRYMLFCLWWAVLVFGFGSFLSGAFHAITSGDLSRITNIILGIAVVFFLLFLLDMTGLGVAIDRKFGWGYEDEESEDES